MNGDALVRWLEATLNAVESDAQAHLELQPDTPDWPTLALAEVAAKRRILDWLDSAEDWMFDKAYGGQPACDDVRKLLALPLAGELGYREEWRP